MKQPVMQSFRGLDLEEVVRNMPSIGKAERWSGGKLTDKYTPIPTTNVLTALDEIGYVPTFATQSRSRIEGKEEFTKHYIRLAHKDTLEQLCGLTRAELLDREFFEIALVNSFDGSSSYLLHQAVTRLACTNGLIVSGNFSTIHVRHKGNIVDGVLSGTLELAKSSDGVLDEIQAMKNTRLDKEQQLELASTILKERFGATTIFEPSDLLRRRRGADTGDSVWTTLNVVQENAIRGGIRRYDARLNTHTARQVKGIDQSLKINQAVWEAAKSYLN